MKSVINETIKILKDKNQPIHYNKISDKILKYKKFLTKTPRESIRSMLSLSKSIDSYGHGLYGLKQWRFKWYKKFHKEGIYYSVGDICYITVNYFNALKVEELINKIEKKYPSRYKNLKNLIRISINIDQRLVQENGIVKLRKFKNDFFKPNDMKKVTKVSKAILLQENRPVYYKEFLRELNLEKIIKLNQKDLLLIWLSIDNDFVKLGPKGYFGLREWVK